MRVFALAAAALLPALAVEAPGKGKTAGNPGAPVTIEVFSDFQCPSCKGLHEQTLAPLMKEYVAAGKVYLVHRDFPLQQHPYARAAASYADAAARLGLYEEVAAALFHAQAAWSVSGKVDDTAVSVLSPAQAKKVRALVNDPSINAEIEKDAQLGQAAGVKQTPTMFVMHRGRRYPFSGLVNYDLLRSLINDLLKK